MNWFDVDDVPFADVSPSGGQHHPDCFLILAAARMKFIGLVVGVLEGEVLDVLANLVAFKVGIELTMFTRIIGSRRGDGSIRGGRCTDPIRSVVGDGIVTTCSE